MLARRDIAVSMIFFTPAIFWLEILTRLFTFGGMRPIQFFYILLFTVSWGALFSFGLSFITNKKARKITAAVLLGVITVIFSAQTVYYEVFKTYFSWDSVGMAGQLTDFWREALTAIGKCIPRILLLFVPFALLLLFFRKFSHFKRVPGKQKALLVLAVFLSFSLNAVMIYADKSEGGALFLYDYPTINESSMNFGIMTSTRLGLQLLMRGDSTVEPGGDIVNPDDIDNPFLDLPGNNPGGTGTGTGDDPGTETGDPGDVTEPPLPPVPLGDNVMDIDFEKLIAEETDKTIKDMHQYFSSLKPTAKNAYTGFFKGKNLIFMTLEGFSGKVIDPELTPTLYKMSTEGFVFPNFYNSCWGGSTATGEYANMTGLFYNSASCLKKSASISLPFALGNQFSKLGYTTLAYHANTYTYYSRNLSHPNMGYTYLGRGNGIENLTDRSGNVMTKSWPFSDLQLADVTIDQYINKTPFHVYYMTISGHCNYNWGGNAMSKLHRAEVQHLDYSEEVKAYIACQLEVELMVKQLVDYLDEAGILEDTVFVMEADHYPYGLSHESLAELYGLPVDNIEANYDLYRNSLIIWSACMKEPVVVDAPCSAIDIIPTVSNLFGLEYDSRLLPGTDLLSDTDPFVIINCNGAGPYWGWINRYGSYSTKTGFVPAEGYTADATALKSYVKSMTNLVTTKKKYTFQILTNDYYRYVFGE